MRSIVVCVLTVFVLFSLSACPARAEGIELAGVWSVNQDHSLSARTEERDSSGFEMVPVSSRLYLVNSGPIPEDTEKPSCGGALNLKYYSGISYDYLQQHLAGKTVSLKVIIPSDLVGVGGGANRIRVTLKSEKDGEWADYYTKDSWLMVKSPGTYDIHVKIPEGPVQTESGAVFYPDNTILVAVEFDIFDKTKAYENIVFAFYDFMIEGVDLDQEYLKWQFVDGGYSVEGVYLSDFAPGSTAIYSMGPDLMLDLKDKGGLPRNVILPGTKQEAFLTLKLFVPEELRLQKGTFAFTFRGAGGETRSSVKSFDSCNLEGDVYLTVPLDAFIQDMPVNDAISAAEIDLRIKTAKTHALGMMPFVISPLEVQQGHLIPFDDKWNVRDIQGLGGYSGLDIRDDLALGEKGFTVRSLDKGSYQLDLATRLQGGIDWTNPYYRVELIRELEDGPIDLDNMHLEVIISPLDDSTDSWQMPFRARLGVMDTGGAFMFGPNISLSEGLPSVASLDVSINNPIPKGLTSPGFDPKKIKAIIINFEGSHGPQPVRTIKASLVNLSLSPREYPSTSAIKKIDFSSVKSNPEKWQVRELIKKSGGFLVGINYPFPVVDVPPDVLKVPQIYPCVGMKPTDPRHFGMSGHDSRKAAVKAFSLFAEKDLSLVRMLILGHLTGVFEWGPKGTDIKDFGKGMEPLVQEAAGMSVEKLAAFLNENEETFFVRDDSGTLLGLEEHVMPDFTGILDILEEIERTTGKRLVADLSLYDFLIGDGSEAEGPFRIYTVGEHPEVVTDQLIKTKALCLTWKILRDLSRDPRFLRYVGIVEIMNEPANATILSTRKHFVDLLNFVGEGIYLVKDAIGPDIPVTAGFRSWPEDLRYWAPIGDGVDILMPHYWESLESYNIDIPEMWLLDTPAKSLWDHLGQKPGDRLTGMGEIAPRGKLKSNLFRLEKAGYDFALIWSFSGHDGHDARPVMDKIGEYQEANLIFGKIRSLPKDIRTNVFIYLKTAFLLFDLQEIKEHGGMPPAGQEKRFPDFMVERLKKMKNAELKAAITDVMTVAALKEVPLSQENIQFLGGRALEVD